MKVDFCQKAIGMTRSNFFLIGMLSLFLFTILPELALAQLAGQSKPTESLPAAPGPQPVHVASAVHGSPNVSATLSAAFPATQGAQMSQPDSGETPSAPPNGMVRLTRTQAEQLAMKNNPQISVGKLLALAQHQVYREARAGELPNFNGNITAADANEGSRIGAGALTASRLLEHAGGGVTLTQLLTDFGRTINLVSSAKLQEKAQNANALATTEDIVLATDQAFYNALEAQALLKVAQQTVTTRGFR